MFKKIMKESSKVYVKRKGRWILISRSVFDYNRSKAKQRRHMAKLAEKTQ